MFNINAIVALGKQLDKLHQTRKAIKSLTTKDKRQETSGGGTVRRPLFLKDRMKSEKQMVKRRAMGRVLATYRRVAGLTQRGMAEALGVSVSRVKGWEYGTRHFYIHEFMDICGVLGVDPVVLTGRLHDAVQQATGSGEVGFI